MSKRSDNQAESPALGGSAGASRTSAAGSVPSHERPADETVKEMFESIIIAFILAFVFRAYVVEAFVIPTGSMAPTLLGEHISVTCDQCGYGFTANVSKEMRYGWIMRNGKKIRVLTNQLTDSKEAVCRMCRYANSIPSGTSLRAGDRILVQKYIYNPLHEPQCYDVVVFKNPQERNPDGDGTDGPNMNYIKRLIGTPEEELLILEGNIYVKQEDGAWRIARKTKRPEVQRAVWQPIYDSNYIPLDGGKSANSSRPAGAKNAWRTPWVASGPTSGSWQIDDPQPRRSYRYTDTAAGTPGTIVFDFARHSGDSRESMYIYNQLGAARGREPIEDVRIAAVFQPDGSGLQVRMSTTARLDGEGGETERLTASIDAAGQLLLEASPVDGTKPSRQLAVTQIVALPAGRRTAVELWFVDQEASVWINGELALSRPFDLSFEQLANRPPPANLCDIAIEVSGSAVTLHDVQVDRDLYYGSRPGRNGPATGGMRRVDAPNGTYRLEGKPLSLGADEFFCLGDNSPLSHDGRYWDTIDPWVKHRMFAGEERFGVVPRELMMGRAFFVYFPAMFPLNEGGPKIIPNFGRMRVIH
jgi:signal peptidase I